MAHMRQFNAWEVLAVGVLMDKVNPFQIQPQQLASQFARKSAKLIFDVHRPEVKALVAQKIEVEFVEETTNVYLIVIY